MRERKKKRKKRNNRNKKITENSDSGVMEGVVGG